VTTAGEEHGSQVARPTRRRRRLRFALLAVIALLYLASVPWYRTADAPLRMIFGLPDWVAVALACYIGVAVLNAIAWLLTDIPDVLEEVGSLDTARDASTVSRGGDGDRPR